MDYFGRNRNHLNNNNKMLVNLQRDLNKLMGLIESLNNSLIAYNDNLEKKLKTQSETFTNVTKNMIDQYYADLKFEFNQFKKAIMPTNYSTYPMMDNKKMDDSLY